MAEGARPESVYTATYRGFESPPHRHILRRSSYASTGFFRMWHSPGDENPRPGFDNWQRQLDRPRACERAAPQGRAKRVNPPSPPYFKKSSYASTGFFRLWHPPRDENPRPGFDNWQQTLRSIVKARLFFTRLTAQRRCSPTLSPLPL